MLARKYTLGTKYYFDRAKEKGTVYQGKFMAVAVYKRKDKKVTKYGFVISKKIAKLATQRNRIRRAMSEAARQNIAFVKQGFDAVFLAKKNILTKSTDEIMSDVSAILKTANLLK